MDSNEFVLVQGARRTRGILTEWNAAPGPVIVPWILGSLTIAIGLLLAVLVIAHSITPDPTPWKVAGITAKADIPAVLHILLRNSLVLALHAFACIAGFIAGSSLPAEAGRHKGIWKVIHEKAGPLAITFVVCATWFSLATQALVLGDIASTTANGLGISPGTMLLGLSLHAVPELTALFLPLAAWIIASRSDKWDELLAATVVTVTIAIPVLIASAFVEVYVSPHIIVFLQGG